MPPILCAHLLGKVDHQLVELLRSLSAEEWERRTIVPRWNVKQIAAHLLDTQLRKLSIVRDGYQPDSPAIHSEAALIAFINALNAEGVAVYGRLSPEVLISLLELASTQSAEFHVGLDPFAPAGFAVSWAGEQASLNWFDTARELTERWHHQQQIRLAVHRPGIMTSELYHPVLDCFLRALPYRYKNIDAPAGATVRIEILGECGGDWWLKRDESNWILSEMGVANPAAHAAIPQEIAWRVFTKGIAKEEALSESRLEGDVALAGHVLGMTAIVG